MGLDCLRMGCVCVSGGLRHKQVRPAHLGRPGGGAPSRGRKKSGKPPGKSFGDAIARVGRQRKGPLTRAYQGMRNPGKKEPTPGGPGSGLRPGRKRLVSKKYFFQNLRQFRNCRRYAVTPADLCPLVGR
jgi:hypothetical protein